MKRPLNWIFIVSILFLASQPLLAQDNEGTWAGEVVDMGCYIEKGLKGSGHAGCAKSCIKKGMPMGVLTKDGTLLLLTFNHDDGAPYEALKDLAGENAEVSGTLSEKDGIKMIVVSSSKAAKAADSKEAHPKLEHPKSEHPKSEKFKEEESKKEHPKSEHPKPK
jgi:hypothetical protein